MDKEFLIYPKIVWLTGEHHRHKVIKTRCDRGTLSFQGIKEAIIKLLRMGNSPHKLQFSWELYDKDSSNEYGDYLKTSFKQTFKTFLQSLEASVAEFEESVLLLRNILLCIIGCLVVSNLVCIVFIFTLNRRTTQLESHSHSTKVHQSTSMSLRDFGKGGLVSHDSGTGANVSQPCISTGREAPRNFAHMSALRPQRGSFADHDGLHGEDA